MSTYSTAILATTGLVSYWQLNETSGTTATDSKGTNNGTYTGGYTLGSTGLTTASSTTPLGTAVTFNGTTAYITVPNSTSLAITSNVSAEAWVKFTSFSGSSYNIVEKAFTSNTNPYVNYSLTTDGSNSGKFSFGIAVGTTFYNALSNTIPTTGQWYHVVGTYDGTNIRIYVNGLLDGILPVTGSIRNDSQVLTIGAYHRGTSFGQFFPGLIDEVAVYNVALSSTQVLANYNTAATGLQKARISQVQTLVIDVGTPKARLSQLQTLVVGVGTPSARMSQIGTLLVYVSENKVRVSQMGALIVYTPIISSTNNAPSILLCM
jgi:hypothetical protein